MPAPSYAFRIYVNSYRFISITKFCNEKHLKTYAKKLYVITIEQYNLYLV